MKLEAYEMTSLLQRTTKNEITFELKRKPKQKEKQCQATTTTRKKIVDANNRCENVVSIQISLLRQQQKTNEEKTGGIIMEV